MSTTKPDNTERNARIIDLARQGKAQTEIGRELNISRGIVSGVIRRARDVGTLAKVERSKAEEGRQPDATQSVGGEEE
jgi:transposase